MKFIPVNTCVAADFRVDIPQINIAKKLLADKYGSRFNIPSHITLLLMPYTQAKFDLVKPEIENYFQNLKPVEITFEDLVCDNDKKFFSLAISKDTIYPIHKKLLDLAGKYRTTELREKDIKRLEEGRWNESEKLNLEKYGFVFTDNLFNYHLTLGNVSTDNVDLSTVTTELKNLLGAFIGKKITLNKVKFMFHTDAPIQSDMIELWSKEYLLS